MTLDEVVDHFGSRYMAAKALGIAAQNFTHWANRGSIPIKQQFLLESITKGKLKAATGEEYLKEAVYKPSHDSMFGDLELTEIMGHDMSNACLSQSLIENEMYIKPIFKHSTFSDCDFDNVYFKYPNLMKCVFSGCTFRNVRFEKPVDEFVPKFQSCRLDNVEFIGIEVDDLEFNNCDLKEIKVK